MKMMKGKQVKMTLISFLGDNMIPKKIHYIWFGKGEKNERVKTCIESWKKYMPDYEIIEWNEDNFDINYNDFTKKAYANKKWAFVSDVARLWVLYNEGGIYIDFKLYENWQDYIKYQETNTCIMSNIFSLLGINRDWNATQRIKHFTIYPQSYFFTKDEGWTWHSFNGSW